MDRADHDGRAQLLAARQRHARHAAVPDEDFPGARVRPDLAAEAPGRLHDRVRHRAHAPLLEAPGAEVAVAHVADRVVQHDVGRARLVGPGPGADDAVHGQHALHGVRLEPVVHQVGDAHGEQARDVGHAADPQLAHLPAGLRLRQEVTRGNRSEPRGHLQEERSQDVRDPLKPVLPLRHRLGVLFRKLRDRGVASGRVAGEDLDGAAIRVGLVVGAERRDLVPEILQPELPDDGRRHQRHDVGVGRDLDLGMVRERGAGCGRPAGLVAGLQDDRPRAGAREIGPADQPVVPSANDDRVVRIVGRHECRLSPSMNRRPSARPAGIISIPQGFGGRMRRRFKL